MYDMDLLLINPTAKSRIYGRISYLAACEPPLWCRLIAGYVQDRGFRVRILDAEAFSLSGPQIAEQVEAINPKLVCIVAYGHQPSASTQQMVGVRVACDAIKNRNHTRRIILTGPHVSTLPERTLQEERCDYACVGEGPVTVLGLLDERPLAEIPGLVWFDQELPTGRINKSAPLIEDLDKDLHGDVWNMLPMSKYYAHNWHGMDGSPRNPYASVYTSLGCPYSCGFCMINAPFESNRYRMRRPSSVLDEIVMLHQRYGIRTIKIEDEMFVLNPKHVDEICNGLINAGIGDKLNIWAYARVDTIRSTQQLKKLRAAGFRWLALGIESGSKLVRDGAQKRLRNNDIIGIVRQIQEAGINVIGNFIFGLPDDTEESMEDTLILAKELNCEFANFYGAMAYPGSKLYTDAINHNIQLPSYWSGYSQHSYDCRPLPTETLSSAAVLSKRDSAFTEYFTSERYLRMIRDKFGEHVRADIVEMASNRLERELLE